MKSLARILLLMVLLGTQSLRSDCTLGAPTVAAGSKKATKLPFKVEVELAPCYKFIYPGCEGKGGVYSGSGSGSGSGNGGNNNDDDDDDDDDDGGGGSSGNCTFKATIKDTKPTPKTCSSEIKFQTIDEFNKCPLKKCNTTTPTVFKADSTPIKIKCTWEGTGNAPKPNGTFNILGTYQKDPPPPVGNLSFAVGDYSLGIGTKPPGVATITRD